MRGKVLRIGRWKLGLRNSLKRNKNGMLIPENSKFFFKRLEYRHKISCRDNLSQIPWCLAETRYPSRLVLTRRPTPRRPFPSNLK